MAPSTRSTRGRPKTDVTEEQAAHDESNRTNTEEATAARKNRRKEQFNALHEEMELLAHGVSTNGQARRKMNPKQSKQRTKKRKLLESQDDWTKLDRRSDDETRKMRGSKVAAEERVIQGSLIFGGTTAQLPERDVAGEAEEERGEDRDLSSEASDNEDGEESTASVDDEDDAGGDNSNGERDEDEDVEGETDVEADGLQLRVADSPAEDKKKKAGIQPKEKHIRGGRRKKTKKSKLSRLRNFRSTKMAEKHGDALGAHAQGMPGVAIRKLKQVALQAPSAPQIYSSLGMVYEDMLQESQRKGSLQRASVSHDDDKPKLTGTRVSFASETTAATTAVGNEDDEMAIQDRVLREQLGLAKKAYGSYHVAAILCKRDYSLWLRAADSASEIAALHTTIMQLPEIASNVVEYHRAEKLRWLQEAKSDYQSADNLNPPGIDIPAKLAHVMIELGLLSEALTLLTELKNHVKFEESHRAWRLYADLMLRIGHECNQWNRGVHTNSNYMFRRWLRKLARTFDWQERRLQALVKALEAACGSESCDRLLQWLRRRAAHSAEEATAAVEPESFKQGQASNGEQSEVDNDKEYGAEEPKQTSRRESGRLLLDQNNHDAHDRFQREKELLLSKHNSELAAFDKTTRDLNFEPASLPAKEREKARESLIQRHNAAVVSIVGDFHGSKESVSREKSRSILNTGGGGSRVLPLSGSCRTVYCIASELMRHLLGMQLYTAGKLAGEAVSLYLKARAALKDNQSRVNQVQQQPVSIFATQFKAYDTAQRTNDSDSDDMSEAPLSDEDDIDSSDAAMMNSLRNGMLPPELRLLYGLCLAAEKKVFLACNCIQSIETLPQEPRSWLSEQIVDTSVSTDSLWIIFQRSMTEPFGRTCAFAFAADVLRKTGKEIELSERVTPLFRRHVADLSRNGMIDAMYSMKHNGSPISRQRQNQLVMILVAETRYEVGRAESHLSGNSAVAAGRGHNDLSPLIDAIDSLSKLLPVVWKVERDGSISSTSAETVGVLSRTLRLFSKYTGDRASSESVRAVHKMVKPIAFLCGASNLAAADSTQRSIAKLTTVPLPCSWLSADLESLSRRSFNLCVATNVSLFSGWEDEEFSVRLLRGMGHNFFGISMDDGQVAGHVSEENEEELIQQWDLLRKRLPDSFSFDFRKKLIALRGTAWYKSTRERHMASEKIHKIVAYGEDDALSALLSFSRVCLGLTAETTDNEKIFFIALSILLPVSQFCLNESLWEARIGQRTASVPGVSGVSQWPDFSALHVENVPPAPSHRKDYVRPSERALAAATDDWSDRALHEWFSWEDGSNPLSNLVSLPISSMQRMWRRFNDNSITNIHGSTEASNSATIMHQLDYSMAKLRACYTTPAIEKVSLQVASNLLQLAGCHDCNNPFACLHQAAMYASQAPKGGTSDQVFQAKLPRPEACTAHEALIILGRADCLQAVYFCQEAAFLCSYVASVCSIHRAGGAKVEWCVRWRIVAALAYNHSVCIRNVAAALIQEQDKREDTTGTWEGVVMDELRNGRSDGLSLKGEEGSSEIDVSAPAAVMVSRHVISRGADVDILDELDTQPRKEIVSATEAVDMALESVAV